MLGRYKKILSETRLYLCNYIIAYIPSHTIRQFYYKKIMNFDLGEGCSILLGTRFTCKNNLKIGKHSVINQDCLIDNRVEIRIGDNVSISRATYILTAGHDIQSAGFVGSKAVVIIEKNVFIGSRATILPGVHIEEGAVVAAAALVTKNVAAFEVVGGVPAKKIKTRNANLDYTLSYKRLMH